MTNTTNNYFEEMERTNNLTKGASKALRAWEDSQDQNLDEIEMRGDLTLDEACGFVKTLRNAGVETFNLTDTSSDLMNTLINLMTYGCKIEGVVFITKEKWGETIEVKGLKISLN